MLLIPCPFCGQRPEHEFGFGGDASVTYPGEDAGVAAFADYLYLRDNPKGLHTELWVHRYGCGRWLTVERDTVSHEILSARFTADPHRRGQDT